jgi:glycosyltransferase involved in cell wall biosynthesis
MPKVLIITYHFPPSTSVGGIRPGKFAKYLPEFGWEPRILTVPTNSAKPVDHERLRQLAHLPIDRPAPLPTPLDAYLWLKGRVQAVAANQNGPNGALRASGTPGDENANGILTSVRRTGARCFSALFELPDKEVGWLIPAVVRGMRVIRRENVNVIFATSPPTTPAVVGLALSVLTGRPLVTDLRDPLILHARKPDTQRTRLSDAIERWLEREIMRRSVRIITTTTLFRARLSSQFPELSQGAIDTITNGFDPDDFAALPPCTTHQDRFTISYFGTFYYGRTPRDLLRALGELVREGTLDRRDLDVTFYGDVAAAEGVETRDLARQFGLSDCVDEKGQLPYGEALRQMIRASVLLLLAPDQPMQIPAKAFEYLAARRRILCVSSPGATADLIRESGAGYVIEPNDVPGMKRALRELYHRWKAAPALPLSTNLTMYDRRTLTGQLSTVLASALSGSRGPVTVSSPTSGRTTGQHDLN